MNTTDLLSAFDGWAQIGVCHYLVLSLIIFLQGLFLAVSTRNIVKMFIGILFSLNAVCINFIAINSYVIQNNASGQIFMVIILAGSTITAAAGISIIIAIFNKNKDIDSRKLETLREEGSIQ